MPSLFSVARIMHVFRELTFLRSSSKCSIHGNRQKPSWQSPVAHCRNKKTYYVWTSVRNPSKQDCPDAECSIKSGQQSTSKALTCVKFKGLLHTRPAIDLWLSYCTENSLNASGQLQGLHIAYGGGGGGWTPMSAPSHWKKKKTLHKRIRNTRFHPNQHCTTQYCTDLDLECSKQLGGVVLGEGVKRSHNLLKQVVPQVWRHVSKHSRSTVCSWWTLNCLTSCDHLLLSYGGVGDSYYNI